ncbi:hypothetical protein JXQ31_16450 [candidate division KSB1 bacterium]|nr:hypothetical protein [candidate division KSB1 bacterium]
MKNVKFFKPALSGVIIVLLLLSACSKDNPVEPKKEPDFIGNWDIYSVSWTTPAETGTYNKSQLDSLGLVWKLKLKTDGAAEQITNIDGPLLTLPGTWTSSGNKLYIAWTGPTGGKATINYDFSVVNNILSLSWTYAGGANKTTAEYVRIEG